MCRWICSTQYRGSSRSTACVCVSEMRPERRRIKSNANLSRNDIIECHRTCSDGGPQCEPQTHFDFYWTKLRFGIVFDWVVSDSILQRTIFAMTTFAVEHPLIAFKQFRRWDENAVETVLKREATKKKLRPSDFVRVKHVTTMKRGLKMDT